jgi:hypothetical protein
MQALLSFAISLHTAQCIKNIHSPTTTNQEIPQERISLKPSNYGVRADRAPVLRLQTFKETQCHWRDTATLTGLSRGSEAHAE